MPYSHYDRLTALDASFLALEDDVSHMHVGSIGIFDAAPLRGAHGGIDHGRIEAYSEAALARLPRFRQRLQWVPLYGRPVWIDDERFNLHYHVRHTALPKPGDLRQLKRLAGRIMSQQLDRGKPLWEIWYVEGLEGDRFAIISKVHHCMVDGLSGVDLMAALMRVDADASVVPAPAWMPRPAPGQAQLLADEALHRAALPLAAAQAGRAALAHPGAALEAGRDALVGVYEALTAGLTPASPCPLNVAIGPHRRFDWTRMDLAAVKGIRHALGGTVNDVVLAIVAGALRRFLRSRGERPQDLALRAMVPVSVRRAEQRGTLGNRVSFVLAGLPVGERDARQRLRAVCATTAQLKGSQTAHGTELLEELSDRTFLSLFVEVARLGARARSYNLVVTNVPGPPFPVYFLGAPMREIYPVVPLYADQALGIALFSYDGGLFWGFNADWDALPDLHDIVGHVDAEFQTLCAAAGLVSPAKAPAPSRRRQRRPTRATRPAAGRSPRTRTAKTPR